MIRGLTHNLARVNVLQLIWPYIKPNWRLGVIWMVSLAISSGATLLLPISIRHIIDVGFSHTTRPQINSTFIALFGVSLILAFATAARIFSISLLGERTLSALRKSLYSHLIELDLSFFEKSRVGELTSRLGSDTEVIQALIGSAISVALRNTVLLAGSIIAMAWTSSRLAWFTVLIVPSLTLPVLLFGRRVKALSRASQDRLAEAAAIANETFGSVSSVKACTRELVEAARYGGAIDKALETARERIGVRSILTSAVIVSFFGVITLVLWVGARDVLDGSLSSGVLSQFVIYALVAASAMSGLSDVWGSVMRATGAMERIGELFSERPTIVSQRYPVPISLPLNKGIRFEGVSFSYPGAEGKEALTDFSLEVKTGETVAFVGPSGAGKSTLFSLMLRFYDPTTGSISWDGVDVRLMSLLGLRNGIALVPQESAIFGASVVDNIRFGKQEASLEQIEDAAWGAEALDFIRNLEAGFDTQLGERGVRLSGGQRQRISVARALVRNAPILLLDEATSALDAESEGAIQLGLERLQRNRTTMIIAHRLSTVMRADRIVVMDRGRIVSQGTHETLMLEDGLYARLARLQLLA